jgi:hypothetical protein
MLLFRRTVSLAGAISLIALTGVAQAEIAGTNQLSAEQISLVQQTCSATMRIPQGFVQYDACIESLSQTLIDREEIKKLARSYDACTSGTLREGTPEFALCVLNQKNALGATRPSSLAPESGAERESGFDTHRSFSESNAEQRRILEEHACAKLGLVPGQAAFGSCVSHLDVNLWSVANPS